jgi:hypothetical protein
MELKDLVGEHLLSGFEYGSEKYEDYCGIEDDRQYLLFILDGITYLACENPEDGYRSCMEDLEITDRKVSNVFTPIKVYNTMMDNDDYQINDVLEIHDGINGKVILSIGTINIDDYYPCFHCEYNPENMEINRR